VSLHSLKDRLFPGGVQRTLRRWQMRVFRRVRRRDLVRVLRDLGIPAGARICIHSQLSALGHLPEGPGMVIDAVLEAVPGATVLMPTFPFPGAMLDWVQKGPVYDPRRTPSASGALSEALRLRPDAIRGLHPTHPCAAAGPDAALLIEGSEESQEPFGPESSYGRYAASGNAWQLLIHTNHTSIVHYFQEVAGMPNLFLPGLYEARGLDWEGREHRRMIRVHRPVLPLYVALPEYVWLPDFVLPFPSATTERLERRFGPAAGAVLARQRELESAGVIRAVRYRDAEIAAVHVPPWSERVCAEMKESFRKHPECYELPALEEARARGLLAPV